MEIGGVGVDSEGEGETEVNSGTGLESKAESEPEPESETETETGAETEDGTRTEVDAEEIGVSTGGVEPSPSDVKGELSTDPNKSIEPSASQSTDCSGEAN